jgi:molecular chaperone DnaK
VSYGLGIDLGTSFTRAAIGSSGRSRMLPLGGGSILLPSVVRVQHDGTLIACEPEGGNDDPFRTGRNFKHRLGESTPLNLGGQPQTAVSLLAATLTSVIDTVTATEDGPPDRVVLTHPAVWDPGLLEEFAKVPRWAGLDPDKVTLITEPEAAARHFAARGQLSKGDVAAVVDLGGGSFDSSVIRMTSTGTEILGTPEEVPLTGGAGLDDLVLAHVDRAVNGAFSALDSRELADAIALQRIRSECVQAKERLSREDATNIPVLLPGYHLQVRLTRTEFEAMISATLEATLTGLHRTLRSASIEPADLTGILLVGGCSRIPLVARRFGADLGRPVLIDPHPQHCVALGAGAIAARGPNRGLSKAARRPERRRRMVVAATAATALLAGAGGYLAYDRSQSDENREPAAAQALSLPTAVSTPGSTTLAPTASAVAAPVTTTMSTTTPVKPSPTRTKTRNPTPPKPKTPKLPLAGAVLGLEAQCLDVVNARSESGTPIQTTSCNGTGAQMWSLRTDHTFRALGKCMDVGPAVDGGRRTVQLQECAGTTRQKWRLLDGKIVNSQSKLCLDVLGNNPADRIATVVNPCTNDRAQKWKLASDTVLDADG